MAANPGSDELNRLGSKRAAAVRVERFIVRRLDCSKLDHLLVCKRRKGSVDPIGKRAQMTRRNQREEMVFRVIKHAVTKPIDPAATLGASNGGAGIAAMMHRPYCKKSGQALSHDHRPHMPPQCVKNRNRYSQDHDTCESQNLYDDPAALRA